VPQSTHEPWLSEVTINEIDPHIVEYGVSDLPPTLDKLEPEQYEPILGVAFGSLSGQVRIFRFSCDRRLALLHEDPESLVELGLQMKGVSWQEPSGPQSLEVLARACKAFLYLCISL
jgi:hypothetical protein